MHTLYKTLLPLFLLLTGLSGSAQTRYSGWAAGFSTVKTGKKTSLHTDVQFRSADQLRALETLLLRAGLNYKAGKQITLSGGYAFIRNRRSVNQVTGHIPEHRLWQQLIVQHKISQGQISHRFRIEQRFPGKAVQSGNELTHQGYGYASRFRYFLRNIIPFRKEPAFTRGFFGALQNEVFLNLGDKSDVNGEVFDQNRLYLAFGHRLNPATDLELGYMNQYINGRGTQFSNNHILQLAAYFRL